MIRLLVEKHFYVSDLNPSDYLPETYKTVCKGVQICTVDMKFLNFLSCHNKDRALNNGKNIRKLRTVKSLNEGTEQKVLSRGIVYILRQLKTLTTEWTSSILEERRLFMELTNFERCSKCLVISVAITMSMIA